MMLSGGGSSSAPHAQKNGKGRKSKDSAPAPTGTPTESPRAADNDSLKAVHWWAAEVFAAEGSRAEVPQEGLEANNGVFDSDDDAREIFDESEDEKSPPATPTLTKAAASTDNESEIWKLLKDVGAEVGRTESEMEPIFDKLVKENWLDNNEALRALSTEEWRSIGLPVRLSNAIRKQLDAGDPTADSVMAIVEKSSTASVSKETNAQPAPAAVARGETKDVFDEENEESETSKASKGGPDDSVNSLLTEVGQSLGRSPEQIADIVDKIVVQNWIDTKDRLREATDEHLQRLGIPVVFIVAMRKKLRPPPPPTPPPPELQQSAQQQPRVVGQQQHFSAMSSSSSSSMNSRNKKSEADLVNEVHNFVYEIGEKLGRSKEELDGVILEIVDHNGIHSMDDFTGQSSAFFDQLCVPLRILSEIRMAIADRRARTGAASRGAEGVYRSNTESKSQPAVDIFTSPFYSQGDLPSVWGEPTGPYYPAPRPVIKLTIQQFLIRVGQRIGKNEDEMQPFVKKIVEENWFDSLDSLRRLSEAEWRDLDLPKRLRDDIVESLGDPDVLDLSDVYFHVPDPSLFPCDVQYAVHRIALEVNAPGLGDSLRSLIKLMETILARPYDRSKRRIKKSNPNFQKRAGRYRSTLLFLECLGYVDIGDYWVLPVAYTVRLTQAHRALTSLAVFERQSRDKNRGFRLFK